MGMQKYLFCQTGGVHAERMNKLTLTEKDGNDRRHVMYWSSGADV